MKDIGIAIEAQMDDAYKALRSTKHTVSLTLEEIEKIRAWCERDKAMLATKNSYGGYSCPVCAGFVGSGDGFCSKCGQRIDKENVALE
jgi:hypothetical protein